LPRRDGAWRFIPPHPAERGLSHGDRLVADATGATGPLAIITHEMNTTSLDILERSQLPSVQARAILQAMDLELASKQDVLATRNDVLLLKNDLLLFESRLRQEMANLKAELVRWVFTCILGQTIVAAGLIVGALYFFLAYIRR
jgi:hypothetical protein